MTWGIVFLVALVTLAQGRFFESQYSFTIFGRNKGWIYLDKMTIAPGYATMEITTWVTGLPYGKNKDVFVQAIKEDKWEK